MPLQNQGPISLLDIATEFGNTAPYSMDEFYGAATGIPAQGAIGFDSFYGASAIVLYTHTITTNQQELNLYNYLIAQGWNGSDEVEVTINSGVYIWSDNTAVAALNTGGAYPNGLTLINNGFIMGKGGRGADASIDNTIQNGQAGGPAIILTAPVKLNNTNGYIGGGGGGGGQYQALAAVGAGGGGGAGGGIGGTSCSSTASIVYAPTASPLGGMGGFAHNITNALASVKAPEPTGAGGAGGTYQTGG